MFICVVLSVQYQSVCKVGTGFKDEDLARLFEKMRALVWHKRTVYAYIHTLYRYMLMVCTNEHIKAVESKKKPYNYNVGDGLLPDDWFQVPYIQYGYTSKLCMMYVYQFRRLSCGSCKRPTCPRVVRTKAA